MHLLAVQEGKASRRALFENFRYWAGTIYKTASFDYAGETILSSLDSRDAALKAVRAAVVEDKANFVILLLHQKNVAAYSNFKDIADRTAGVHSLCLVTSGKNQLDGSYWGNVMMKVNLKAGGINHTVPGFEHLMKDTLVLGAQVFTSSESLEVLH